MAAPWLMLTALLALLVAVEDAYARRVSNLLLLTAMSASLMLFLWVGENLTPHLGGLGLGLLWLLPFYVVGWMGAGDVKLFAVFGWLLGWTSLLPIWVVGSLLAGVHALLVISARQWPMPLPLLRWQKRWQSSRLGVAAQAARAGRTGLPYASYLGAGALLTVFHPHAVLG